MKRLVFLVSLVSSVVGSFCFIGCDLGGGGASWPLKKARERALEKWARRVPLTGPQQEVMLELWRAFKSQKVPTVDPLSRLNADDVEYLVEICGAPYRPAKFGKSFETNALRLATYKHCKELGFSKTQAAIITGMLFNRIGLAHAGVTQEWAG